MWLCARDLGLAHVPVELFKACYATPGIHVALSRYVLCIDIKPKVGNRAAGRIGDYTQWGNTRVILGSYSIF